MLATPAVRAQQPRPWHQLSPDEQRRAWENYRRYQQLPENKQRSLEERYQRFQAMPPQDRDRLRQNYETYRGFDPGSGRSSARSTVAGSPVSVEPQIVAGMIARCAVRDGSRCARISSRRVINPTPSSR